MKSDAQGSVQEIKNSQRWSQYQATEMYITNKSLRGAWGPEVLQKRTYPKRLKYSTDACTGTWSLYKKTHMEAATKR